MGRPREHDEATRLALLDAAEQQLSRGEPLSVRGVADAVGTTTRAVYSLFGSMDGLHQALTARAFDEIRRRAEALPVTDDPAGDLVRAGVAVFRSFASEHPNLFRIGFERMVPNLSPTPEVAAVQAAAIKALHAFVVRMRDAGLLGGRVAREVTWQFHAFCQGLASVEMHGWFPPGEEPATLWRDALATYVAGLASPAQRARTPAAPAPRAAMTYKPLKKTSKR
jgi:AcrR family transcriptional regulator